MTTLRLENITLAFQDKPILENISLDFPSGKITAILGPNGCGKSTLLRVVTGFQKKYIGSVLLNGKSLQHLSARYVARHMAILPQAVKAPADLNVAQLVAYGRFPYRGILHTDAEQDNEVINWAMQQTRVDHLAKRQLDGLSGGERQRAWIAMALCQQPEILLLDEPTTYLDIAHQLEIMQIIRELNKKRKMTVIMVLHDINHARMYADNVVVIKDHTIFAQGVPQEIISVDLLASVFNVRAQIYRSDSDDKIIFPIGLYDGSGG